MARGCSVGLLLFVLVLWPAAARAQTLTTETSPTFTVAVPPPAPAPTTTTPPTSSGQLTDRPTGDLADTGYEPLKVIALGLWMLLLAVGLRMATAEERHFWRE